MTEEQAQALLKSPNVDAEYKGRRDGVDWYWSKVRQRWIGKTAQVVQGRVTGVDLRELPPGKGCGC